jgi:L-ascorbate metabolism protein UlaG (beta-lactamase superfamily)
MHTVRTHSRISRGCRALLCIAVAALAIAALPARAFAQGDEVLIRWLGVAGFSIVAGGTTLVFDPYFSRYSMVDLASHGYRPDRDVLKRMIAADGPATELAHPTAILIGHSHVDHLGDAPWIASATRAPVYGSETTVAIVNAYGGDQDCAATTFSLGETKTIGPFSVLAIESRHSHWLVGHEPFPGTYRCEHPPHVGRRGLHALLFRLGDTRSYLVTYEPTQAKILLVSSAGVPVKEPPEPTLEVDVLLAAVDRRDSHYTQSLVSTFRPRVVVPQHYDDFFVRLYEPGSEPDRQTLEDFQHEFANVEMPAGRPAKLCLMKVLETRLSVSGDSSHDVRGCVSEDEATTRPTPRAR